MVVAAARAGLRKHSAVALPLQAATFPFTGSDYTDVYVLRSGTGTYAYQVFATNIANSGSNHVEIYADDGTQISRFQLSPTGSEGVASSTLLASYALIRNASNAVIATKSFYYAGFVDVFNRSDRSLSGDNGWGVFNILSGSGPWSIASQKAVAQPTSGGVVAHHAAGPDGTFQAKLDADAWLALRVKADGSNYLIVRGDFVYEWNGTQHNLVATLSGTNSAGIIRVVSTPGASSSAWRIYQNGTAIDGGGSGISIATGHGDASRRAGLYASVNGAGADDFFYAA